MLTAISGSDVRWVESDGEDWSLPFVPAGTYTLVFHGDVHGWVRVNDVVVDDKLCNVGAVKLEPGGRIVGRLDALDPRCHLNAVIATDQQVVGRIARYIAGTIDDGSTLQIGPGRIPNEALKYLEDRQDLGHIT